MAASPGRGRRRSSARPTGSAAKSTWPAGAICRSAGRPREDTSEYYEKGLLAPGVDYDAPHPYLAKTCDRLDPDGYVNLPKAPGLGYEIVWDYINDNLVEP